MASRSLLAADVPPALAFARALENGDAAAMREALAAHARMTSLDEAAELFARTLEAVPRNREFRVRYERALAAPILPARKGSRELFLLVPGWRYRSEPATGADLAQVQRVLERLALATRLAPIGENDTVEANAEALATEIERLAPEGRRLILVSTSKGGPETHLALDRLRQAGRAGQVAAWVNIGGLLHGTAIADYWDTWPRSWLAAIGLALGGHHARAIPTMTTAASRARLATSQLPQRVLVFSYIGVPRERDLTDWTRTNYAILAEHGPNDGLTLLPDAIVPQGITVAELGFDHFFRTPDLDRRIAAMAIALLATLDGARAPAGEREGIAPAQRATPP
ncbi:MAG TPA: hypothetical protein VLC47_08190 [Burkholderiales bacterium]|nr:hypothetical protein [Burkholderiales bacterium]